MDNLRPPESKEKIILSDSGGLSFSPLFDKLLKKRGLAEPSIIAQFLNASLEQLEDPFRMKGMRQAVARIEDACKNKEKILIHGDYDVDGVTAAALLARTLQNLNASFEVFLPDRVDDGYGVSERAIREAKQKGVSLLMTADCGITAKKAVETARSLGIDVIIIDHHRVPEDGVPPANVILNPQQSDCPYPFKELSAAGLAFKLAYALLGPRAFQFLDLAALSTVCDVAPLQGENRIIVKKGLDILSERTNPGVRAIIAAANVKAKKLNTGHVGFMIGPRINAAGRMSSPDIALRLLLTENSKEAESLAQVLEEENKARQKEERDTTQDAISQVEKFFNFNRDRVIVAAKQGWHPGVIGIVASRLVDRFHRPAIVIALDGPKGKGSGRSIKGFHLFNSMNACKELCLEFGGHEQAAGLSIMEEHVPAFREKINAHAHETYNGQVFIRQFPVDLELRLEDLRAHFLRELELLEPHGAGNPRPVFFTKDLEVKTRPEKIYGDTLKFYLSDGVMTHETIYKDRGSDAGAILQKGSRIDLVYSLKSRVWDGMEILTLEAKQLIPHV